MKVLSIDVGIKNLAFCLFEKENFQEHFSIGKWDVIDISDKEDLPKCCFTDNNKICNKLAKFKKDNCSYCLKHSKKQILQLPTSEQKPSFINKQKIQKLFEIADNHHIKYESKVKKNDLIQIINNYIKNHYLESIETKKASEIDLFNIGLNIKTKFNKIFEKEEKIDYVIIENQISPIATRMKTIQGMLVQYFIMSHIKVDNIEFISASNKLKDYDIKEKSNYSDRKKLGILKCHDYITTDFRFQNKLDYFNVHKKKDDLSDSFLQGIWYINNKKI